MEIARYWGMLNFRRRPLAGGRSAGSRHGSRDPVLPEREMGSAEREPALPKEAAPVCSVELAPEELRPARFPRTRGLDYLLPRIEHEPAASPGDVQVVRSPPGSACPEPQIASGDLGGPLPPGQQDSLERVTAVERYAAWARYGSTADAGAMPHDGRETSAQAEWEGEAIPAWLYAPEANKRPAVTGKPRDGAVLGGIAAEGKWPRVGQAEAVGVEAARQASAEGQGIQSRVEDESYAGVPFAAVVSCVHGEDNTGLMATLGRALSCAGERVLLSSITPGGGLPLYFGQETHHQGSTRTVLPPARSGGAPVDLINLWATEAEHGSTAAQFDKLLGLPGRLADRVLLEISPKAPWMIQCLGRPRCQVLVPASCARNAVAAVETAELFFAESVHGQRLHAEPVYVLTDANPGDPHYNDLRQALRERVGKRLVPCAIRKSSLMSEALAAGMTVIDYAPESAVAKDFADLAAWLQTQAAAQHPPLRGDRYGEY